MMMKFTRLPILVFAALIVFAGCKEDGPTPPDTLKDLYKIYKNGQISQCLHEGKTVYGAGLNAYDAGSVIYDENGTQIGVCDYAWGTVDPICQELTDCEVVYRCEDHITGRPAVDIYGLGK